MGFPVIVGSREFTSQDFLGRNYVLGYPDLLKEFENRSEINSEYLDLDINKFLYPSFGSIELTIPTNVTLTLGQRVMLTNPSDEFIIIVIDSLTAGNLRGRVVYLSDEVVPGSIWKLGLAAVRYSTAVPGYLENRETWAKNLSRWLYQYRNDATTLDGTIYSSPVGIPSRSLENINSTLPMVIKSSGLDDLSKYVNDETSETTGNHTYRFVISSSSDYEIAFMTFSIERVGGDLIIDSVNKGAMATNVVITVSHDRASPNTDVTVTGHATTTVNHTALESLNLTGTYNLRSLRRLSSHV